MVLLSERDRRAIQDRCPRRTPGEGEQQKGQKDIDVEAGVLTIRGQRKGEQEVKGKRIAGKVE